MVIGESFPRVRARVRTRDFPGEMRRLRRFFDFVDLFSAFCEGNAKVVAKVGRFCEGPIPFYFQWLMPPRGSSEVGVAQAGARVKGIARHEPTRQNFVLFSTTYSRGHFSL